MLDEMRPGDVVVCRDQSRLGRDAMEATLAIRDIVRDRGCRLFYYSSGQEVAFKTAMDQAMTFVQGTGHQMELEAIRSRVTEALRSRVAAGRIAGGRCYGYDLQRIADGSGRPYTVAVVNEREAAVVRRILKPRARYALTGIAGCAPVMARSAARRRVRPATTGSTTGASVFTSAGRAHAR